MRSHDLSSVRQVFYGGSPMPSAVQRRAAETIDCEWVQAYSMTEPAPGVTICRIDHRRALAGEEPDATRIRSAGTPIMGVEAEVRRRVAGWRRRPGEIWVRGCRARSGSSTSPYPSPPMVGSQSGPGSARWAAAPPWLPCLPYRLYPAASRWPIWSARSTR